MKRKLFKSTMIYGLGSISTKLVGVILLPLLTHKFTKTEYGIIGIMMMFSIFLNALMSIGLGSSIALVYFDTKNEYEKSKVILTAFYTLVIFSLFVVGVCLTIEEWIRKILFEKLIDVYLYILVLIATFFMTISIPFMLNLQFKEKVREYVFCSIFAAIVSLFLNIFFVLYLERGVNGYFEAYLLTQIVSMLIFTLFNKVKIKLSIDRSYCLQLLKNGIPMIPSFFSLFIINQSNRYLLNKIAGIEAVGLFTVGFNIGSVMQLGISAFQSAWTPYFLSFVEKQNEAKNYFYEIFKFFWIGVGFLTLCFFIFSKLVTIIFINEKFLNSYMVIGWVALANFFIGVFNLLLPPMYFSKEIGYVSFIQVLTAVISIIVNYILIFYFSYIGAAIGYAISYGIMCLLTHIYNKGYSKSVLKIYYDGKFVIKMLILFFSVIIVTNITRNVNIIAEIIISIILGCGIIFLMINYFLNKYERNRFLKFFPLKK